MPRDAGPSSRIYHLALRDQWRQALDDGADYRWSTLGRSYEDEGYIHCSFAHQVQAIADLVYRSRSDVVLLEIDPALLNADVRVEHVDGGEQAFPHLYGPLPVEAVIRTRDVPVDPDGRLVVGDLPE